MSLLATMHQTCYKLYLHAFTMTRFFSTCEPEANILKGRAIWPPPGSLRVKYSIVKNDIMSYTVCCLLLSTRERLVSLEHLQVRITIVSAHSCSLTRQSNQWQTPLCQIFWKLKGHKVLFIVCSRPLLWQR